MDLPAAQFSVEPTQEPVPVDSDRALVMVEVRARKGDSVLHTFAADLLRVAGGRVTEWRMVDAKPGESDRRSKRAAAAAATRAMAPAPSTKLPLGPSSVRVAISTTISGPSSAVIGAAARFSAPPRSVCSQPGYTELTLIGVSRRLLASAIVNALSAAFDPWYAGTTTP